MTSLLDVWRAIDPSARLISGTVEQLSRPVRGVTRTRAAPPHLPPLSPGHVLFVDGAVVPPAGLDALIGAVHDAALEPVGLWVISEHPAAHEPTSDELPVLLGGGPAGSRTDAAAAYLDAEAASLAAIASELRLLAAEAALADPQPRAPSGVVAAHLRRGVAVSVDGALASLTPRSAGRALATRFAATHARLLGERAASLGAARRTRDGLWIVGRPITDGSAAWLFDDLPFARVDEVALEALAVTLRALLRRRPEPEGARRAPTLPPSSGDALRDTLLAVARANGRVTPAARALGVHRNTVLYRLRRASAELGIDPRRPDDALRLLEAANRD